MTERAGDVSAPARDRSWDRWFGRPGRSLTRRLIWLASAWIVLALVLTGWALTSQYQESALRRLGKGHCPVGCSLPKAVSFSTRGYNCAYRA